ncbi:MAG: glycoside hydrolase family 2 TIM barrel-domain containing protein [Proteiniphilum sp.]|jgi:beta-galactosidase|uniref:glycoside hydrolase family 2 TIM barrel-domain containing protein n=1 Tax=Proteiniphilum sp. TaxID=1926877 RepID=UPI002B20FA7C|nr:glycoside hydrolase family 2 TIM barrel-domain containing protein [Proteiniphilum sp.]MEA5127711.1 glycoside hydrolase family 2 TIM barrel-domain containing protein [Proteiniphilum sp.]
MKNRIAILLLLGIVLIGLNACRDNGRNNDRSPRKTEGFNEGWRFYLGEIPEASNTTFDDHGWRQLELPHDWAIEGDFSEDHPSGSGGGALPGGIGWYRKSFFLDKSYEGKKIFVDFDGVYMNSDVWINGIHLGYRPFGYISFRYDLTPHLKFDGENIISVRVDNSEQPNSRWYSGCGIYRNVWLTSVDPVYVDLWGVYVTTPEVTQENALVSVRTTVKNEMPQEADVRTETSIVEKSGKKVASASVSVILAAGSSREMEQDIPVRKPVLWTLDDPYLYEVVTRIFVNDKQTDEYVTPFGIRHFTFDAEKGFFLNGKSTKIRGVCMHHDLGCLGAAVNMRAIERQLEILREMGVNGIRTAHNPPAPELLRLCDQMGFIVMNETFDMWRKRKTTYDYSRYFNEWHEKDLTDHILRDRNHPSVFMWSIGNEVLEQWTHVDADTLDIQQANLLLNLKRDETALAGANGEEMSVNALLTKKLADIVKRLDPTRPVTTGNNETNPANHLFRSGALDLIGFNYHGYDYPKVPENFPGKPFIATETTSGLMTRGYYRMPSDSMYIWPVRWDIPFTDPSYACSSYDNCHVPWGCTHEQAWNDVKNADFISGMYIWTGFDYLGEPTPFWFPARSSYFGIVDLAGFPKDVYYMYQSEWTDKEMLHLFPHWNWQPGELVDVWAYYNQADEVELFLNGVSQGIKRKEGDKHHVFWRLAFEPGTIKAVSRKNGKEVLAREIKTAGEPAQIRLTPDRRVIKADGQDLSFITVEVLDEEGTICPNADNLIRFNLAGNGKIAGVDNGNPTSMERFKASERKAFYGKCLVVVKGEARKGRIHLTAESDGLLKDAIEIEVTK